MKDLIPRLLLAVSAFAAATARQVLLAPSQAEINRTGPGLGHSLHAELHTAAVLANTMQEGSLLSQMSQIQHKRYKEGKTGKSHALCIVLAVVLVTIFASAPLIAFLGRPKLMISLPDKIQGGIYLIWVAWGFLSPCLYLEFESKHWEGRRTLDIVESVYFVAQVLTTVGYGDITPAHRRARIFVSIHAMFALAIVVDVLKQTVTVISNWIQLRREKMAAAIAGPHAVIHAGQQQSSSPDVTGDPSDPSTLELDDGLASLVDAVSTKSQDDQPDPLAGPRSRLRQAALLYVSLSVAGMVFWATYPNENKTWTQGFYLSIITLSTIGFGAFVPETEVGMIFDAYWMIIGAGALVNMVVALNDLFGAMRANDFAKQDIGKIEGARLDRADYFKFVLTGSGRVTQGELLKLDEGFSRLRPGEDGKIAAESLIIS